MYSKDRALVRHLGRYLVNLDPNRVESAAASLLGAAVYGLYRFAILINTGQPVTARDVLGIVTNIVCAVVAGVLLAFAVSGVILNLIPWASLKDPWVIGFGLGAFGWELLPLAYKTITGLAGKQAGRLTEGDS